MLANQKLEKMSLSYEYASNVSVADLATKLSFECDSFFNLATRDHEEMKFF